MAGWNFFLDGIQVEEPIGWDAVEFTAIRMESHGIDQPFSTELKFYNEGARYIKQKYDQYFINAEIAIQITSDVAYSGTTYQFDGFLNLSIYEEHNVCDTDSWEITVGIIDDNFREKFKARQDVDIALESNKDLDGNAIDPITYKSVRLHRQDLYLTASARQLVDTNATLEWDSKNICVGGDAALLGWTIQKYSSILPAYYQNTDFQENYGDTFDPTGIMWSYGSPTFVNNANYARNFNVTVSASTIFEFTSTKNGAYFLFDTTPWNCLGESNVGGWVENPFFKYSGSACANFLFSIYDSSDNFIYAYVIGTTALVGSPGDNQTLPQSTSNDWSWSGNINLQPGYKLFFSMEIGDSGDFQKRQFVNGPLVPVEFWYQARWKVYWSNACLFIAEVNPGDYATFCNGLTIEQYLKRMLYVMTGSNNKLLSDTFSESGNGCYWNNLLTNGLKIRNAPSMEKLQQGCNAEDDDQNETKLKTNWKDIFDNLDRIFCLGWAFEWDGSEWKIRVEKREYFYQNAISQTFNDVGEITQMAKVDKLMNSITLGYTNKWKNIQLAGAYAIHTDRTYFIANRAMAEGSTAKLEMKSDIIAEGYAVEFYRRLSDLTFGSSSSDRPNDYDIFIIWLNKFTLSGSNVENTRFNLPLQSGAYSFAPGTVSMPSDYIAASSSPLGGLYNIYHTPARVACRWWKVLGMHTYGLTDPKLRYQVGEYQTTYSSTIHGGSETEACIEIQGGAIAEDSDISAAILNPDYRDYLFKPIAIEFSYPQSLCDFLTLSQDEQYKKVRLTSGSLDIQGFITQASNQPEDASGGTTKFTLLMSAQDALIGGAFTEGFDTGYENEPQ